MIKFVQIGFNNMVSIDRIIAVVGPDSSPIKRIIQDARDMGTLVDASSGRKTQSVLLMDSDHIILSSREIDEIINDINKEK